MPKGKTPSQFKDVDANHTGYFSKLSSVLFSPAKFFKQIKAQQGLWQPFKFLLITYLIFSGLFSLFLVLALTVFISLLYNSFPILEFFLGMIPFYQILLSILVFVIIFLVLSLLMSFVGAGILHLFVRLFRGKGNYLQTYKAGSYASAVMLFVIVNILLYLLPVVGSALYYLASLVILVWQIIIMIQGLSLFHEMSKVKAFFAWLFVFFFYLFCYFFLHYLKGL